MSRPLSSAARAIVKVREVMLCEHAKIPPSDPYGCGCGGLKNARRGWVIASVCGVHCGGKTVEPTFVPVMDL